MRVLYFRTCIFFCFVALSLPCAVACRVTNLKKTVQHTKNTMIKNEDLSLHASKGNHKKSISQEKTDCKHYVIALDFHDVLVTYDKKKLAKYLASPRGWLTIVSGIPTGIYAGIKYICYKSKHCRKPVLENLFSNDAFLSMGKNDFVKLANMFKPSWSTIKCLKSIKKRVEKAGNKVTFVLASNIGPMALGQMKGRHGKQMFDLVEDYFCPNPNNSWCNKSHPKYFVNLSGYLRANYPHARYYFTDDKMENVRKARMHRINGTQFTSTSKLKKSLEKFLELV